MTNLLIFIFPSVRKTVIFVRVTLLLWRWHEKNKNKRLKRSLPNARHIPTNQEMSVILSKGQRRNFPEGKTLWARPIKFCIRTKLYRYLFPLASFCFFEEQQQEQQKSSVHREHYLKEKSRDSFSQVVFNHGDIFVYFQSRSAVLWYFCFAGCVRYLKINSRNQSGTVQDASRARFEPHGPRN